MKTGSLKIYSFHNFPYVRKCGMDNMVPRLDFIFTPFVMGMISEFFLFCNHLSSTNDTYLATRRGKSYYGGKGYYIVRFPPGEKLLYSQFSGGKGYYTTPACQGTLCLLAVCLSVRHTSVFPTFLCCLLRYWLEMWYMNLPWHNTDPVWAFSHLTHFYRSYCPFLKFNFPGFSLPSFEILSWNLVYEFIMT